MRLKTSSAIALLALAAVPLGVQAGDVAQDAALDACVKAFTTTYIPNHVVRDTKANMSAVSPALNYYRPSSYTIELRALGVKSGETLARARCQVDRNGVVRVESRDTKYTVTAKEAEVTD
ncbi:hypothetical protein HNQ60_005289 [Povalibacter uvarum]|uniref:Uncharacterized protein n=1 Tax=Povalibacter uvarum TaxID=732238 RepID=A0A841HSR7_9GAMM|nr:hypothetical protein [Povalibacter uvarum]MBB6096367.1 hypothetical protein [Povalibacter uvarum]